MYFLAFVPLDDGVLVDSVTQTAVAKSRVATAMIDSEYCTALEE